MLSICSSRWRLIPAALANLAFVTLLAATPLCDRAWADEPSDSVARAYNRTGFDLFAKLAADPGNLVISPYSVGSAMAMAAVGARGETEREMMRVLNFGSISLQRSPRATSDSTQL